MIVPMFTMVILTLIIAGIALKARFVCVRSRQVGLDYFRLMGADSSSQAPENVITTTRAFSNMFEIPVLFYVIATLAIAMDQVTPYSLVLAWSFVISRCIHTWIHLTYNNVIQRMYAFWVGIICILAMWVEQLINFL